MTEAIPAQTSPAGDGSGTPPPTSPPPGAVAQLQAERTPDIPSLPPATHTPAALAPLNPKTGEPRRPWTTWVSATFSLAAVIGVLVGLGRVMWDMASPFVREGEGYVKTDRFAVASWLSGQWVTEPGSGWRVLLAVAVALIGFVVAAVNAVIGFYSFRGYSWTKIGALVAVAVSGLTLLLNQWSWSAIAASALAAIWLWLPVTAGYFARWRLLRQPENQFSEPVDRVFYGPLPRYR